MVEKHNKSGLWVGIAVFAILMMVVLLIAVPPIPRPEETSGMPAAKETALPEGPFVFNEIAWMGGEKNHRDEWIELYNGTLDAIDLAGWSIRTGDGTPRFTLSGTIEAGGYLVIARGSQAQAGETPQSSSSFVGSLNNKGEHLQLIAPDGFVVDEVDHWYAGDNQTKATMSRRDPAGTGTDPRNWFDAREAYPNGFGSPRRTNGPAPELTAQEIAQIESEQADRVEAAVADCSEHINQVSEEPGAINVYFNKSAKTAYARPPDNRANHGVNLEQRLIHRLEQAQHSIELAAYELNLNNIVATLMLKALEGVMVRVIIDAKVADDSHYLERFALVRLLVERMIRGIDGRPGTADDVAVFSDSPLFAVEDPVARRGAKLPPMPDDFPRVTYAIARGQVTGYLLAEGEARDRGAPGYYSPRSQMHNKYAVIDGRWVFTGSWNFTLTGLYGNEESRARGCKNGNQQHVIEIHDSGLARQYITEFNEMWGGPGRTPAPENANFNTRKADNTVHRLEIGGRLVESYFSPSDKAVDRLTELVREQADQRLYFSIFAWSDQALTDALKVKWEGSPRDREGRLTGFEIKGLFGRTFYNQWWSAAVDMTGRIAKRESDKNPNIRWKHPAPVLRARETRKLHSKTMILDADIDGSDPTVVIGATNWSQNGNDKNDENMLIIYDARIANQFMQEFYARYERAGGVIPALGPELASESTGR